MNDELGSNQGSVVGHSARTVLTAAVLALLLVLGLLLLERSGPSPVRPLGQVIPISRSEPATAARLSSRFDPSNRHCADHENDSDRDDALYNFVAGIIPKSSPFRDIILSIIDFDHDACPPPSGD